MSESYREQHTNSIDEIKDENACQIDGRRREHKFLWIWDAVGDWTPMGQCMACGAIHHLSRKNYGAGGHG